MHPELCVRFIWLPSESFVSWSIIEVGEQDGDERLDELDDDIVVMFKSSESEFIAADSIVTLLGLFMFIGSSGDIIWMPRVGLCGRERDKGNFYYLMCIDACRNLFDKEEDPWFFILINHALINKQKHSPSHGPKETRMSVLFNSPQQDFLWLVLPTYPPQLKSIPSFDVFPQSNREWIMRIFVLHPQLNTKNVFFNMCISCDDKNILFFNFQYKVKYENILIDKTICIEVVFNDGEWKWVVPCSSEVLGLF